MFQCYSPICPTFSFLCCVHQSIPVIYLFLIHSPTEWQLGCFQVLAIMNKAVKHREPSLALYDNFKGWDEGRRGRRYMYTCGSFALLYGRNQHNIVKIKEQTKKFNKVVVNICGLLLLFWGQFSTLLGWKKCDYQIIIKLYGKIILVL